MHEVTAKEMYENEHIRFLYPRGWSLEETQTTDGLCVNLDGPETMFLMVSLLSRSRDCRDVADYVLNLLREEYPLLDSEPVEQEIGGCRAVGHDINFFSFDLLNTCWIRAIEGPSHTVLILAQTDDTVLEQCRAMFDLLCRSFQFQE